MAQNEDKWGKSEAKSFTTSKNISGLATKSNLGKWANYAKRNSFDQSASKRQSRADLGPVEAGGASMHRFPIRDPQSMTLQMTGVG